MTKPAVRLSLCLAVLLLFLPTLASAKTLVMTVIDVGQGDAILIEFPESSSGARKTMLIDGGPSRRADNDVMHALTTKGITTLDFVVMTHPQTRVANRHGQMEAQEVTLRDISANSPEHASWLAKAALKVAHAGQEVRIYHWSAEG